MWLAVAACVAVIVAVPAPTTVTKLFKIVATAVLLDVNVNAPLLFDVGTVKGNAGLPNVLLIAAIDAIVGFAFATVNKADTEPAL